MHSISLCFNKIVLNKSKNLYDKFLTMWLTNFQFYSTLGFSHDGAYSEKIVYSSDSYPNSFEPATAILIIQNIARFSISML